MKKRVLVTGATGFIGSHILEALIDDPSVALIAACRDERRLIDGFDGEVRVGDLLDDGYIEQIVRGVDVICHAAAWTSLWNHAKASEERFLIPSMTLI